MFPPYSNISEALKSQLFRIQFAGQPKKLIRARVRQGQLQRSSTSRDHTVHGESGTDTQVCTLQTWQSLPVFKTCIYIFDVSDSTGNSGTDTWCPRLSVSAITESHPPPQGGWSWKGPLESISAAKPLQRLHVQHCSSYLCHTRSLQVVVYVSQPTLGQRLEAIPTG